MRLLYIGQIDSGGTCLDRMRSLQRLGHEVTGFDVSPFQSRFRLLRSAQWRINARLLLRSLNANLNARVAKPGRFDLVWVDKGNWIFPETVERLRNICGGRAVHFTPDPQFITNQSRQFVRSIPLYDYLVTTKIFEIRLYREAGAKNVILSQQSFCPIRYATPKPRVTFSADVGFVGHYERHYGMHLSGLSSEVAVQVWGNRWGRAGKLRRIPKHLVRGNGLWGADYVDALASFKIGLGLLSKYVPEQHTTRTFEIPAAGTFLLAERTAEHLKFFEEGHEAEFFGSHEELVSKVRFYLTNDLARRRIAERGRERCHRSGYDMDTVLSKILREIG